MIEYRPAVEWSDEYVDDKSGLFKFKKVLVNGRSYGEIREYKHGRTATGKRLRIYFAARVEGELCYRRNAWAIDKIMSEVFRTFAVTHIGVLVTRHMGRSVRNRKWIDKIYLMKAENYWPLRTPENDWDYSHHVGEAPGAKGDVGSKQWALSVDAFVKWERELTVTEEKKRMEPRAALPPKPRP